jgi:hypothetical protein
MVIKKYTSPVKLTTDTWKYSPYSKKVQLLRAMNLNTSWAKTKSVNEMVKRGGGMIARDILNLNKIYLGRKGGSVRVNWGKKK